MTFDPDPKRTHAATAFANTAFAQQQQMLARFNRRRLTPGFGEPLITVPAERRLRALEEEFVAQCRREVAPLLETMPKHPACVLSWFESMREWGPGQRDPLFPWLAQHASFEEMRWFLHQEVAGEAGFEDVLALAQVRMPVRPKLEMARNFWDEMGRGQEKGMHGPMLAQLATHLDLDPDIDNVVPQSLALGNLMMALAMNRAFAFHAIGALGVTEMTAPDRAKQ